MGLGKQGINPIFQFATEDHKSYVFDGVIQWIAQSLKK